jgi:hypothetical protein
LPHTPIVEPLLPLANPTKVEFGRSRIAGRGHRRVALIMNTEVKRDFDELEEADEDCDAVIVADLGAAFGYDVLNDAFRQVITGPS